MKGRTAAGVAALVLAACASGPPPDEGGRVRHASIDIEGTPFDATWYLPARSDASALLLLQPGFTRHCGHLRGSSRRLMAAGLTVLCVDAPMAGGNPLLAAALARRLTSDLRTPDGQPVPTILIVAGHSAGARFALRVGAELLAQAPQRLAGALLFDPVATAGFDADLLAVADGGQRPLLAVLALAQGCNAQLNALPALQALAQAQRAAGRTGFIGLQLTDGSTHADVEGEDSDWIARSACGSPRADNVALLRETAARWAQAIVRGSRPDQPAAGGWRAID